jgi:hypothetical protein
MKSLRAFWHWVDNEKPSGNLGEHIDALPHTQGRAVDLAIELVADRLGRDETTALDELREHWPAVRDLSLSICEALERMHEAVPEDAAMAALNELYPPERIAAEDAMAERITGTLERLGMVEVKNACPACGCAPCQGTHFRCELNAYVAAHPEAVSSTVDWVTGKGYRGIDLRADAPIYAREYMGEWRDPNAQAQQNAMPPIPHERDRYCPRDQLHILPQLIASGYDCDSLRGMSPKRITIHGKRSDYQDDVLRYLSRDVLGPMIVDGATVVYDDPALQEIFGI